MLMKGLVFTALHHWLQSFIRGIKWLDEVWAETDEKALRPHTWLNSNYV